MIFFTSDLHFDHEGVIGYDNRPFKSVDEMNEALVKNWNETVTKADIVYLLGDFCWRGPNRAREILARLAGQIHLIIGNHDRLNGKFKSMFASVSHLKVIRAEHIYGLLSNSQDASESFETFLSPSMGMRIDSCAAKCVLSHYPLRSWAGQEKGVINIHGHCHGNLSPMRNAIDVSCNRWEYRPASFSEIMFFNQFGRIATP